MGRFEKTFLLLYCLSLATYLPGDVLFVKEIRPERFGFPLWMAAHFTLMLMGLIVYILILRDLYKRIDMTANQKLTWGLWIILFWPSIIVYYIQHARHPRDASPASVLIDVAKL